MLFLDLSLTRDVFILLAATHGKGVLSTTVGKRGSLVTGGAIVGIATAHDFLNKEVSVTGSCDDSRFLNVEGMNGSGDSR